MGDQDRLGSNGTGLLERLRGRAELQSALVRIGTSVLGALYIAVGAWSGYYQIDQPYFLSIFSAHLSLSLLLLASVLQREDWPARRYFALCLDVIVVSVAISVTQDAISPFYLLYILIFISAGTRFGRGHLILAAVVAVVAYNFVLIDLDEWQSHPFEAAFFLLLLILLPWYQASLLHQLQRARLDAEQANRAKGNFLAVMTHELRTPLTGVMGMTELLQDTPLDAEQRDHVQAIAHSAEILNALIGDILDFSKIEAGKLVLEQVDLDPQALVFEVCELLQAKAQAEGLELICRVEPDVPCRVRGDPLRLRQILFNLLGNAIKFTEEGEVLVRLRLARADEAMDRAHLVLEVEDTGIGIPRDKLEVLFEGFRQADDSTTRRFGGTGLGTTIARELTQLMGGAIEVESQVGVGSLFRARLPLLGDADLGPVQPAPGGLTGLNVAIHEPNRLQCQWIRDVLTHAGARPREFQEASDLAGGPARWDAVVLGDQVRGSDLSAQVERLTEVLGGAVPCLLLTYPGRRQSDRHPQRVACLVKPVRAPLLVETLSVLTGSGSARQAGSEGLPSAVADTQARPSATRADGRALVAEDSEIPAKVICGLLRKEGIAHERFRDGESALAAALTGDYWLAIVDVRMPKLDGIGFARRFRAERPDSALPIVALTANASEQQRRACLDAGMDAFLTKPIRLDALRELLSSLPRP